MSGSRLTIPEPNIALYEQGFEAASDLGRAPDGKKLSDLVERIEEPMVIAVDAPWGAGKSVFLKCWVGEHIKAEHGNKATTVYFDAFQHDFLDDPLIALTGVIAERFKRVSSKSKKWRPVKEAASKLVRPAARIGLALATAGASEAAGVIVDAGLAAGSEELAKASEKFWKKEDGKRAAMQSFRDALEQLAAEQKLVIVVDELDRCRPDYALNLLEVIKHFFNVPNVHFVLGVNLTELENSVRARYGAGVNASKYLQKFYNVRMPLLLRTAVRSQKGELYGYFAARATELDIKNERYFFAFEIYFEIFQHLPDFSLRDVNALLTEALLCPRADARRDKLGWYLTAGLIALKAISPETLRELRSSEFDGAKAKKDIFTTFGLDRLPSVTIDKDHQRIKTAWEWVLEDRFVEGYEKKIVDEGLIDSAPKNRRAYLRGLMKNSVDTFEFAGRN
ncbi:P-loop NTPase fold protein [uncultured Celeribacter sp.]|uniref:KAP family P-loop NTPase fold protein n=1 Tax=uncultured Celeribacter sp. TaxID=1303376 RepID=UPI002AA74370|nr:P-loop NTPase fold protein [uncultured Celeribacter sp.]